MHILNKNVMKNNIKAIIRIIKQLRYVMTPRQKRRSLIVFFSMLLQSCFELLGVSSIFPLLQLIVTPDEVRNIWYIGWIYYWFPDAEYNTLILILCLSIVAVFLIKNATSIFLGYLQFSYGAGFKVEESTMMLQKYMKRPYEYFIDTNSSEIIRGILSDPINVYEILINLFQACGEMITIIALGIFLMWTDWFITLCIFIIAFSCFAFITGGFKNKLKAAGRTALEATALTNRCGYQAINGMKEIAVLDRKDLFVNEYKKSIELSAKASMISSFIGICPDRILEGTCVAGFIGVICVRLLFSQDVISFIPVLGTFAMGAFRILPSISKLTSRINNVVYNQFGLQNCYEAMKEAAKIEEEENSWEIQTGSPKTKNAKESNIDQETFKDKIKIDGVTWSYRNSSETVLQDLSMEIKKGESVALIGASGAGKTTLADIIMGLLRPRIGMVYMDDKDIYTMPHKWHGLIGYVPQSVYLIDDTIRANIGFGLPRDQISDSKVWSAIEQAQLKAFVNGLPGGLDTIVGERGVKLSGGQRQRIAIARALYSAPQILVLDEATSALDNETETAVMESIDALQGRMTLIIIAHRLTTIRNCNRIFEISDGKAVERKHSEIFEEKQNKE